ncbi:MAG: hypothetical protein QM500_15630 [Methylococcales bacterium]
MLPETDRQVLLSAGIENPESVEKAAAQFIREHPVYSPVVMKGALLEHEEHYLRAAGAVGVDEPNPRSMSKNITLVASEYAIMVTSAYSQKEVAKRLKVSTSRVRQKIAEGSLYAITGTNGRVCPKWQFCDEGALPNLEIVLSSISKDVHPVSVQRFFLTISPDLESSMLETVLSPRDWLVTGHPPNEVLLLASAL